MLQNIGYQMWTLLLVLLTVPNYACGSHSNFCNVNLTKLTQFIIELQHELEARSIIVLQHDKTEIAKKRNAGFFFELLTKSSATYLSVYDIEDFVLMTQMEPSYMKIMVVSLCPEPQSSVLFWNDLQSYMSQFAWVTLAENATNYFGNVHIPFDCEFVVAEDVAEGSSDSFRIFNIYRTYNSSLYQFSLGTWRFDKKELTLLPFDERRENLHGVDLKVHVYKGDQTADDWFVGIGQAIYSEAALDLGRRLNGSFIFTLDEEDYEFDTIPNGVMPEQSLGPLYNFRFDLFFREGYRSLSWKSYLKPFSTMMWLGIIVCALCSFITLICSYGLLDINLYHGFQRRRKWHHALLNRMFADSFEKGDRSPTHLSSTLVMASWVIASVILLNSYSAVFISFITVVIKRPPFTTLEEILENGHYNIAAIPDRSYTYWQMAEDKTIKELFIKHVLSVERQPATYTEAFHRLCSGKEKLVTDFPAKLIDEMKVYQRDCISDVSIKFIYGMGTWTTKPNSPFRRVLKLWSYRLTESGSLDSIMWPRSTHYRKPDRKMGREIDIYDMASLMVMWMAGVLLAVFIFFIEKYVHGKKLSFVKATSISVSMESQQKASLRKSNNPTCRTTCFGDLRSDGEDIVVMKKTNMLT